MFFKKRNYDPEFTKIFLFLLSFDLTSEELKLLIWRFYNRLTYRECGKLIQKSRGRAHQIVKESLHKIREELERRGTNDITSIKRQYSGKVSI
jgi:DNA-directed RNA polymerase specialized sigma subunit